MYRTESWHRIMMIAATKMTQMNLSENHQNILIKFEIIRMNETKVEKPSAYCVYTIVSVCMI